MVRERATQSSSDDAGFTMIEMVVALVIIGIVMSAFTTFFITTVAATNKQSSSQGAVQLADDGIERARALKGSALTAGRDKTSSDAQWNSPVVGVAPYLTDMVEAYDATAQPNAGASASLPTTFRQATINNLLFTQYWYIGTCWQPAAGGVCGSTNTAGYTALYRVVVAVTWPDKGCATPVCSYVTTTLISGATSEPIFNANGTAAPPTVTNPGAQTSEATVPDTLQIIESGGAPTLVWAAVGLPAGLSINTATGLISGTPTSAASTTVTVSVTDGFGLVGSAAFLWTINALPALANPGPQYEVVGTSDTINRTLTGGTPNYTWTATGLPAGLSIDSTSGVITGTPTTAQTATVLQTVTDSYGKTSSATFTITVAAKLTVATVASQVGDVGTPIAGTTVTATGGYTAYSWAASNLPAGLTISSTTGKITGTPTTAGTKTVSVTVTDAQGFTASTSFTWTVAAAPNITSPSGSQTTNVNTTITTINGAVTGGTGTYTWSVTGLPTGLTFSTTTGSISGKPTVKGSYTVVVKAVDSLGASDTNTFSWTVK